MLSRSQAPDVPRPRLLRNFTFLAAGEVLSKGLAVVAYAYLARALGPVEFGTLEFALAVVAVLMLVLDSGLGLYGACETGKDCTAISALMRPIATLRLILMVTAWTVLLGLTMSLAQPWSFKRIVLLYGLALLPLPASLGWVFHGTNSMAVLTIASLLRWLVFAAGVGLLVAGPTDAAMVPIIETAAVTVMVVVYLIAFRRRFGRTPSDVRPIRTTIALREALPIGASDLAWALRMYSPTVLLGIVAGGVEVGWFGSAHRIVLALHTFVWLYFFNVLPSVARASRRPVGELQIFVQTSLRLTGWCVVFLGIGVTVLALPIVTTLYGPAFAPAATTLPVLIWVVPLAAISGHYRYVLIGHGQQRCELAASASGAAVSILLGVTLAHAFGMRGVALALVASEIVIWIVASAFVKRRVIAITAGTMLWKPLVAGLSLAAVLTLMSPESGWSTLLAASIGYWVCAVLVEPGWRHSVLARLRNPSAAGSEPA